MYVWVYILANLSLRVVLQFLFAQPDIGINKLCLALYSFMLKHVMAWFYTMHLKKTEHMEVFTPEQINVTIHSFYKGPAISIVISIARSSWLTIKCQYKILVNHSSEKPKLLSQVKRYGFGNHSLYKRGRAPVPTDLFSSFNITLSGALHIPTYLNNIKQRMKK